ncbi:hypothetical protein FisN_32Lh075 [Fistulifera solaris]|jgi:hypothetical protein|uniref:Uncharacterized protein n=1 Tax=Fistulifera solaris TaxID=1519565 RepID=A0A1Z5JG90_FISSO|nr:hypothetical protein FisN_32Lh075 [Fistulifera solaris]|eukprot:GAX12902.1 hypothetical protein FisN_32Lh075 [Fistulifera solaris]
MAGKKKNTKSTEELDALNPEDLSYSPPKEEAEKGELQKFMETSLNSMTHVSYIYMIVQAMFPEWDITNKSPYAESEAKQLEDKQTFRKRYSLKFNKLMIMKEIRRRDPKHKEKDTKNQDAEFLLNYLASDHLKLTDERDVQFVKHFERESRKLLYSVLEEEKNFKERMSAVKNTISAVVTTPPVVMPLKLPPGALENLTESLAAPATKKQKTGNKSGDGKATKTATPSKLPVRGRRPGKKKAETAPAAAAVIAAPVVMPSNGDMNNKLDALMMGVGQITQAIAQMTSKQQEEDIRKEISALKKELRERQLALVGEKDAETKKTLTAFVDEIRKEIAALTKKNKGGVTYTL